MRHFRLVVAEPPIAPDRVLAVLDESLGRQDRPRQDGQEDGQIFERSEQSFAG